MASPNGNHRGITQPTRSARFRAEGAKILQALRDAQAKADKEANPKREYLMGVPDRCLFWPEETMAGYLEDLTWSWTYEPGTVSVTEGCWTNPRTLAPCVVIRWT